MNKFNSVWVAIKFLKLKKLKCYMVMLIFIIWRIVICGGVCDHVKKSKCKHICGGLKWWVVPVFHLQGVEPEGGVLCRHDAGETARQKVGSGGWQTWSDTLWVGCYWLVGMYTETEVGAAVTETGCVMLTYLEFILIIKDGFELSVINLCLHRSDVIFCSRIWEGTWKWVH